MQVKSAWLGLACVAAAGLTACGGGGAAGTTAPSDGPPPAIATSDVGASRFIVYQRFQLQWSGQAVQVLGVRGSRVYGLAATGAFLYSDDQVASWVDSGQYIPPQLKGMWGLVFKGGWMFAYTDDGRIHRSALDNFAGWTEVSVPRSSAPYLPADTQGRPDVLAASSTHLYYGNYSAGRVAGAHVYRSGDDGESWQEVLTVPEPRARHVHAIRIDPRQSGGLFVTLGDNNQPGATGIGLYHASGDGAAGSFRQLTAQLCGINLAFPAGADRFFIEGDGASTGWPMLLSQTWDALGKASAPVAATVAVSAPSGWSGTSRALSDTPSDDLLWVSTTERGALGTREGVWLARRPAYSSPMLLEDITARRDSWPALGKTYKLGALLLNGSNAILVSDAQADCVPQQDLRRRGQLLAQACIGLRP